MRRGNGPGGVGNHFAAFEDLDESKRLLAAFSAASVIGLAVCDDQLRFQAVNDALAAMNGITPEAHAGNTVRDILKHAAAQPEPALERVLASGEAVCFELTATLPTRTEVGYWIENYFPIKGRAGRVNQVATITVEVTAQRKLEKSFRRLTGELLWTGNQEYRSLAGALHDSINAYHAVITTSLARLTTNLVSLSEHGWDPDSSAEILAQTVEWLDQRIVNMRTIVSDVTSRFSDRSAKPVLVM
jgi:transcriptional regulator with PAS, ATPase and Fis domain